MKTHGFCSLLTYESQRYKFLILCFIWFAVSGTYYGLSINIKNLPGNIYLNGILIYISEIFAYLLSGFMSNVNFLGRKNTMIGFFIISLAVYLSLIIFQIHDYFQTILSFIGRFAITGVYNIIYIYSTEIYPTPIRSMGFGTNSVCARIGGMTFPLLIELLSESVNYLFALVNVISIILVFFLPETLGKPLENSIPEDNIKKQLV